MVDSVRTREILTQLGDMGVKISIDDFGTGYSSLAHLKRLPVSEIKIDKSFVMGMLDDTNDALIVTSTIELGHNMGLSVVCEGVENEATWLRLKNLGCDIAQGFHMGRPLPTEKFQHWLASSKWSQPGEKTVDST